MSKLKIRPFCKGRLVGFIKNAWCFFINFQKDHLSRKAETCVGVSSGIVDSDLFKSWFLAVGLGHNGEGSTFYIETYIEKYVLNLFKYHLDRKGVTYVEAS